VCDLHPARRQWFCPLALRIKHLHWVWHAREVGRQTYYVEEGPDGKPVYCFVMKAVIGKYAGSLMFTGRTPEEARVKPDDLEELVESSLRTGPSPDRREAGRFSDVPGILWAEVSLLTGVGLFLLWRVVLRKRGAGGPKPSRPG
jgi:hypothetical protein